MLNLLEILPTLAQEGSQAQPGGGFGFFPIILMIVIFYFLLIRPQNLQRKKQQELINGLKAGDRVATGSGIIGVVAKVNSNVVTLTVAEKVNMTFTKSSVIAIVDEDFVNGKAADAENK